MFYAERHKMSTFQVTFLFAFMFRLSNVLAGFNENYYEFFTFCNTPVHGENSSVLGCHSTSSGNFLLTFRHNISFPLRMSGNPNIFDSWILKIGPIFYRETSVRNYHYSLRNNPTEGSSRLSHGRCLKSSTLISYCVTCLMNVWLDNFSYTSRWNSHCTLAMRKLW